MLTVFSCNKDTVSYIDPAGNYAVNFDFPSGNVTAPAKVVLINRSKYSDKYQWDFQDAQSISKDGNPTDISSSSQIVPDTLYYEVPGTYEVKLTAWQGEKSESLTKTLVVTKMQPKIVVPENIGVYLKVGFSVEAFAYPGKTLTYAWDFGEGGTSTEANPVVMFQTEGEHIVRLTINDGEESLSTEVTVQVMGELAQSLYFTDVKTGKLFRYAFKEKSIPTLDGYNVSLGVHPMAMQVFNNRVYISDAGNNIYFATAAGDGRIFSVDLKGENEKVLGRNTVSTTSGYQYDPFNFVIDSASAMLFYTGRNFNIFGISVTSDNITLPTTQRMGIVAANAGVSSVYNWIDGGVQIVGSELWYSKQANGKGLYKFNLSTNTFISRLSAFDNFSIRNFIVDQVNSKIYFVLNNASGSYQTGLYRSNLDGSSIQLIDELEGFSIEGSGTEIALITSLAIDRNIAGYLYYGYRSSTDVGTTGSVIGTGANSGIKRYKLDGSKQAEFLLKGYIPYGIAMDYVKR